MFFLTTFEFAALQFENYYELVIIPEVRISGREIVSTKNSKLLIMIRLHSPEHTLERTAHFMVD